MQTLKDFRQNIGKTQNQMAKLIGISDSYFCQIENGHRDLSLKLAVRLSEVFNISLEDVFKLYSFTHKTCNQ